MPRFTIDPHATVFEVSFRPALPGFGLRIGPVTGEVEATFVGGRPDLDRPLTAEFSAVVDRLVLGPRIVERSVRAVIGRSRDITTSGRVTGCRRRDQHYELDLELGMPWGRYPIISLGQVEVGADERVHVSGRTEVHPRDVGIPIPRPLPVPATIARWDLVLHPQPIEP